ncbi:MAG TPA: zf-HC2 domain-containing protein [Candidatus Cybelea sp.]|jgi:anti-sigma factor RsiW|nr:zf-HC2 domain-containing protein [Candidatus Cybelea sp.]
MNCADITEIAPLYISAELDARRASEFDAHLQTCPACRSELESQARLDERFREALLADEVDVSRVNRRIRELIAAESSRPAASVSRPRPARLAAAAAGVAAAFLLLIAGYLLVPGHVARVYADAARDHQLEVVLRQARPWIVDPAAIAALAVQQGIADPVPPELGSGYRLERAKVCRLDGRLYLHLVYSDGTREFSLFLRQRDGQHLTGPIRGFADGRFLRAASAGDEHLLSFETSHLTAMVATDQPADAAKRFAKAASAAL